MDSLCNQAKRLFDLPPARDGQSIVELRSLTHGVPPKAVRKNLEAFFEEWMLNGVDAWNEMKVSRDVFLVGDEDPVERDRAIGWWNLPEVIGDRFIARLLNAPKGTCIMLPKEIPKHHLGSRSTFSKFFCHAKNRLSCTHDIPTTIQNFAFFTHTFRTRTPHE